MARMVLLVALLCVTLGTAVVFVGVLSAAVFYPGVYLIAFGMFALIGAGVLALRARAPDS